MIQSVNPKGSIPLSTAPRAQAPVIGGQAIAKLPCYIFSEVQELKNWPQIMESQVERIVANEMETRTRAFAACCAYKLYITPFTNVEGSSAVSFSVNRDKVHWSKNKLGHRENGLPGSFQDSSLETQALNPKP